MVLIGHQTYRNNQREPCLIYRGNSKGKKAMKDYTSDYSSLCNYQASKTTTTFPGFGSQDEAVKEFTERKRDKNPKGTYNPEGKRQRAKGHDAVRMDIIEQNLLLIADASKGIQIVKPYVVKGRNLANEDTKAKMVKLIAYSLVKKGYGYNLYQQYISQQNAFCLMQTSQKYKSTTISIIQRAFRGLQQFLRVQSEKRVKALRHEQIRYLIRYLAKFNIYFKKNDAATIAKFISLKQELHPVSLSSSQAISLYSSILTVLKIVLTGGVIKPAIDEPIYNKPQRKRKIWGAKYDDQLVQFYQLNQSYPKIHKCFITIHPELSQEITVEFIQQQMERIFRQTLSKIRQFSLKEESSQLIQLSQNRTNYIIKSPACRELRLTLLDFHEISHISNQAGLSNIVNIINQKFDFNPNNTQRKVHKHHKDAEIFETPLDDQPKKHARTIEQEKAQDWSKNVSITPIQRHCIKSNHYQNRITAKQATSNRFEANSEEEYSDN